MPCAPSVRARCWANAVRSGLSSPRNWVRHDGSALTLAVSARMESPSGIADVIWSDRVVVVGNGVADMGHLLGVPWPYGTDKGVPSRYCCELAHMSSVSGFDLYARLLDDHRKRRRAPPVWRCPSVQVEVPGIEPGSSGVSPGLLRAQLTRSLLGPTDHVSETM